MAEVERWKKLSEAVGQPVKLSETEKEKFTNIVGQMKDLMDDNLETMLEMDRDQAYRYLNLLLAAFQEADVKFAEGSKAPEEEKEEEDSVVQDDERVEPVEPVIAGEKPDYEEIFAGLTSVEQTKALRLLDCIKTAEQLKEMDPPEDPDQVLCPHCNLEEMRQCIRTEDPSVKDEMDADLEQRRSGRVSTR